MTDTVSSPSPQLTTSSCSSAEWLRTSSRWTTTTPCAPSKPLPLAFQVLTASWPVNEPQVLLPHPRNLLDGDIAHRIRNQSTQRQNKRETDVCQRCSMASMANPTPLLIPVFKQKCHFISVYPSCAVCVYVHTLKGKKQKFPLVCWRQVLSDHLAQKDLVEDNYVIDVLIVYFLSLLLPLNFFQCFWPL